MTPLQRIKHGNEFPFDASDEWWNQITPVNGKDRVPLPPSIDWAHSAARGILADLQDRRGIKRGFDEIDEATRIEITTTLAAIIRTAKEQ